MVAGPDGVRVATWDLGGDGPALLLLHGTGFHAGVWRAVAAGGLTGSHRVWAVDQRGHGASEHAADGNYTDWHRFAADTLAVVDAIGGDRPVDAAGHSLGGAVALMAEQLRPGTFRSIYCYEPIVVPPHLRTGAADRPGLAELARRRRSRFASRAEALANFAGKLPFSAWDPEVLADYVRHGLLDAPGGGVSLACPPEEEASVYEGATRADAWQRLGEVRCPVTVAAGAPADPPAAFASAVAERLPSGRLRRHHLLDHFGPMVAPVEVAADIAAASATAA